MVLPGNPDNPTSPHAISSMSHHGFYFTLPYAPRNQSKVMSASVSGCETTTKHDPLWLYYFLPCLAVQDLLFTLSVCVQKEKKNHTLI